MCVCVYDDCYPIKKYKHCLFIYIQNGRLEQRRRRKKGELSAAALMAEILNILLRTSAENYNSDDCYAYYNEAAA